MRIKDLTHGEKMYVARRRGNVNMHDMAEGLGVSLRIYRRWENDKLRTRGMPRVPLGRLSRQDVFLILRRRSGRTVRHIAKQIGCSVWWLRQMERCEVPNQRLMKYWRLKK